MCRMETPSRSLRVVAAVVAALSLARPLPLAVPPALVLLAADDAEARARSSGGYSRPSVRTPSASPPSSGGYRRPSADAGLAAPQGWGDQSLSRQGAAEALQRYRAQSAPPMTRRPSASADADTPWGGRRGWVPPPYAAPSPGLGGIGNALMMWFLLDTLTRPGHAAYFHNHQDDPDYRAWRREADRRARDDPELRAKLAALDDDLARRSDQPKNPDYRPPDMPRAAGTGGGAYSLLAVAVLGGGLFLLWRARRRMASGGGDGSPLDLAARMARGKFGGPAPKPSPYRVGMTLELDPTPFILAGDATKLRPPPGGLTSVTAIGHLSAGSVAYDRLYLPGDAGGFFQLHEGAAGVDECRYFSPLDQFVPATADEWAFWLDPEQGLLGWPSFETKDGKPYARLWQPGGGRVEPTRFTEHLSAVGGTSTRQLSAMLYAASTGIAPPAPQTEYILVAAVEIPGQAWIEVHAGIDVNAASLSLPARR